MIASTQLKWPGAFTVLVLLLCAIYVSAALGLLTIALRTGDSSQRDAALALSALLFLFSVFSWTSFKLRMPEVLFFCIYSTLFLTIRPFAYFLSWSNVFFPVQNIQYTDIKTSTIFYLSFLIACLAPFYLVAIFRKGRINLEKLNNTRSFDIIRVRIASTAAFGMLIVSSVLSLMIYTQPEFSHLTLDAGADRVLSVWIELSLVFFNYDEYMLIIITLFFATIAVHRKIDPLLLTLTAASIVIFVAVMSSTGSRGAGVRLVFMVAAILTIFLVAQMPAGRANILAITAPMLAAFALMISILFLPYANQSRDRFALFGTAHEQSGHASSDIQLNLDSIQSNLERMLHSVVFFDYVVVGMARSPTGECLTRYMNIEYYSKNVANYVLLGQPFPEATIPTTSLYRVCLGEKSIEELGRHHSELWTTPGLLRLSFPEKFFTATFIVGIIVALIAVVINSLNIQIYVFIASVWFSFIPTFLTYTFSVDHLVTLVIVQGSRLIVPAFLLAALFLHWRRADQQKHI